MKPDRRIFILAVLVLGTAALLQQLLADLRPPAPETRATVELRVTSSADAGPGSLREAIFAADRAPQRVSILLDVVEIRLESPLPPIVNPRGVVIVALPPGCLISAARGLTGPVLDLAGAQTVMRGVRLEGDAEAGILVRADNVRLEEVVVSGFGDGVLIAADSGGAVIEASTFTDNDTSVRIGASQPGPPRAPTRLVGNRFLRSSKAAVWAVATVSHRFEGLDLELRDNRFHQDRIALVLGNLAVRAEANQILQPLESGLFAQGGKVDLLGNRISGSAGTGILLVATRAAQVIGNEVGDSALVGILLKETEGTVASGNRLFRNGFGIADILGAGSLPNLLSENQILSQRLDGIYVLGTSPLVRGNELLANGGAGIRILEFVPRNGPRREAQPILGENRLQQNLADEPVYGEYVEPPPSEDVS